MKNLYQMRNAFSLREYNTAITRADFDKWLLYLLGRNL